MNKTLELSNGTAVLLRRLVGLSSLLVSIGCTAAILLGFIPLYHESTTVITILYNLFEILNITKKSIWYCVCCAGYSVLYIVLAIKSIKDIFWIVKQKNNWFNPKYDGEEPRKRATNCVEITNAITFRFIFLLVLSYLIDGYKLSTGNWVIIGAVVFVNLLVNYLRMFYVKRNFAASIFSPLSTTLIFVAAILFVFNICNVEFTLLVRQTGNVVRMLGIGILSHVNIEYIIKTVCSNLLLPFFYLFVVHGLLRAYIDSVSYGKKYADFYPYCLKMMKRNLIFIGVIIVLQFVAEKTTQPEAIINSILANLEFILLNVAIYFLSKNQGVDLPDAPYSDYIEQPDEEAENTNESVDAVSKA